MVILTCAVWLLLTGIDQSDYSKLESGKRYYTFEQCRKIAIALDTSMDYLADLTDEKNLMSEETENSTEDFPSFIGEMHPKGCICSFYAKRTKSTRRCDAVGPPALAECCALEENIFPRRVAGRRQGAFRHVFPHSACWRNRATRIG